VPNRQIDVNGYWLIRDNPISKVGVFPYLGSEIGAPDPDKVYRVYRPQEELESEETIDSFNLLPFINDHEFLGDGATPPERKGIQGATGEAAYVEGGYLKNNLRVYSTFIQDAITNGKKELSPSYRCRYDFTPGVYDGQAYDVVLRDIRGNHLARVDKGRTGPDVAVLDRCTIAQDAMEFVAMDDLVEQIKALVQQAVQAQLEEAATVPPEGAEASTPAGDEDPLADTAAETDPSLETSVEGESLGDEDDEPEPADQEEGEIAEVASEGDAEEGDPEASPEAQAEEASGLLGEMTSLMARAHLALQATEAAPTADNAAKLARAMDALRGGRKRRVKRKARALDAATVVRQIAARDQLAKRLRPHIGTFDHSRMISDRDVAKYGCKKLGLRASDGMESAILEGYLQAARAPHQTIVQDSARPTARTTAGKLWGAKEAE